MDPPPNRPIASTSDTRPPATPIPIMRSRAARFVAAMAASWLAVGVAAVLAGVAATARPGWLGEDDAIGPAETSPAIRGGRPLETGGRPMQAARASAASAASG